MWGLRLELKVASSKSILEGTPDGNWTCPNDRQFVTNEAGDPRLSWTETKASPQKLNYNQLL